MVGKTPATPRRLVRLIFDVIAARKRHGLPPYPETVVQSVIWLLTSE